MVVGDDNYSLISHPIIATKNICRYDTHVLISYRHSIIATKNICRYDTHVLISYRHYIILLLFVINV
jgi:hypothetical protein